MGYDSQIVRIDRLENGFTVELYEPDPKKKADASKSTSCCSPGDYRDPWKGYACKDEKAVLALLKERMTGLRRRDADKEYADSFNEAASKK